LMGSAKKHNDMVDESGQVPEDEWERSDIAQVEAAETVDIDVNEPDELDVDIDVDIDVDDPNEDSGFEDSGFDGKTDELAMPPASMLAGNDDAAKLEAMFEQTEPTEPIPDARSTQEVEPDPFAEAEADKRVNDERVNTNPRFEPLEAMPVTKKPVESPTTPEKKSSRVAALVFTAVAAIVLIAAGVFGLAAYRARVLGPKPAGEVVATATETPAGEVTQPAEPAAEPAAEPPEADVEPTTNEEPPAEPADAVEVADDPPPPTPAVKKPPPRRKPKPKRSTRKPKAKPKAKPAKKGKSIDALFDKFGKKD
jgi:hypothetical protein